MTTLTEQIEKIKESHEAEKKELESKIVGVTDELQELKKRFTSGGNEEESTRRNAVAEMSIVMRDVMQAGRGVDVTDENASPTIKSTGTVFDGLTTDDAIVAKLLINKRVKMLGESAQTTKGLSDFDNAMKQTLGDRIANNSSEIGGITRTEISPTLWRAIHADTPIARLFREIVLPSKIYEIPMDFSAIDFQSLTRNVAPDEEDATIGKTAMTAYEFGTQVAWDYEVDLASIIAFAPEMRRLIMQAYRTAVDDLILNADPTNSNLNVNTDTAGGLAAGHLLGSSAQFKGLIARALANTAAGGYHPVDHAGATIDLDAYGNTIKKMPEAYRRRDVRWVLSVEAYINTITKIDDLKLPKNYGQGATLLTGALGSIFNIPVTITDLIKPRKANGKVSSTAANNTETMMLLLNASEFRRGSFRRLLIESDKDIQKRTNFVVASAWIGFGARGDTQSTFVAQNKGVVACRNIEL